MKNKIKKTTLFILAIAPTLALLISYNFLPNEVAMHFTFDGTVDRYGSKNELFIISTITFLLYLLLTFLPTIDPKSESYKKFSKFYNLFKLFIILFFNIIFFGTIIYTFNPNIIDIKNLVLVCIGVLFILMGNYMPQVKQNYYFGYKTPWTLSSETVWNKTHRVGGYAFILSGLIFILMIFLPNIFLTVTTIISVLIVLFPILLSYLYFKNEINHNK